MKKTYNNPTMKVVKIKVSPLLTVSGVDVAAEEYSGGTVLGREFDFDDDEE